VNGGPGPARTVVAGQNLVLSFTAAIRTASYYGPDNAVLQQAVATLSRLLAEMGHEEGSVTIGVHSHCVFIGRSRVRTSVSNYERFTHLIELFETWEAATLTFSEVLSEDELIRALKVFAEFRATEPGDLADALLAAGVTQIRVDAVGVGAQPQAIAPVEAYAAAMQMSEEMSGEEGPHRPGVVRHLRHVTQAVVDQVLRDPRSLVALTTIKDFDRYLITHSTNVAVLSVLLGQRLGLSKSKLGELCLAAFLHDAGKLEVDPDVLQKTGALTEEEWEKMRRHPILAAHSLLGNGRLTAPGMRAVVVAFEHHLNYDMSGYPHTEIKDRVSLFGNIVAITDRYDALTTKRPYREYKFTPHEALVHLVENAGTLFDPVLVKLFAEIMGIYPPGTMVRLSSGELGVVCEPPVVGAPLDRPKVRVVSGGEPGTIVALDERAGDELARSIAGVLNPANMGQLPAVDPAIFALV